MFPFKRLNFWIPSLSALIAHTSCSDDLERRGTKFVVAVYVLVQKPNFHWHTKNWDNYKQLGRRMRVSLFGLDLCLGVFQNRDVLKIDENEVKVAVPFGETLIRFLYMLWVIEGKLCSPLGEDRNSFPASRASYGRLLNYLSCSPPDPQILQRILRRKVLCIMKGLGNSFCSAVIRSLSRQGSGILGLQGLQRLSVYPRFNCGLRSNC